jgi:carbonic anhydrase
VSSIVHPVSGPDALARLREGNRRFAANLRSVEVLATQAQRAALSAGQAPFAVVLSCSDSRVPSEMVFDCGLGDLFVVRVAGNVVAPSLLGSIEFAAASFGTQLVVVMGHSQCGAVSATLDALAGKGQVPTENISDIVERITPSVKELVRPGAAKAELMEPAIRANVRASVDRILHGSRFLEERARQGTLCVAAAEYSLETGLVDFFDLTGASKPER